MRYDYQCKSCQFVFERKVPLADRLVPESEPCPECGEMRVKQAILSVTPSMVASMENKVPKDFKDFLKGVKKANPGSTIKDRS